ncbi:HD domain-containing protein [Hydrogenophaga atypica]|uniref:HD domain-containing protein n=1 Tax=Hydrogenophaga atypica TaxID=249409 RepID=A0ABW2QNK2_9BURK
MLTERISEALALAVQAHEKQVRKGTSIPYVAHPMGVASIALEFGADEDQAIAALLHDVLEDGGPQYRSAIKKGFGERVLAIVEGCTDGVPDASGEKGEWGERKRAYLDHLAQASDDVLLVSGSDKLHNARAIVSDLLKIGPDVFKRFTAGREGTLWYYRSLAEIFERRRAPMAAMLAAEVRQMEQLASINV